MSWGWLTFSLFVSTVAMLSVGGCTSDLPGSLPATSNHLPIVSETTVGAPLAVNRNTVVSVSCRVDVGEGVVELTQVDLSTIGGSASQELTLQADGLWVWSGDVTPTASGPQTITFRALDSEQREGTARLQVDVRQTDETMMATVYVTAHPIDSNWSCVPDYLGTAPSYDLGESTVAGGMWRYDFTQGAAAVGVAPRDFSLLGTPREIHIRLRGDTQGHSLRLRMLSHLTVFDRVLGSVEGSGEHEFVVSPPPGDGWIRLRGPDDGSFQGVLRVGGLFLDAVSGPERGWIELPDIRVGTQSPADRTCVMVAQRRESDGAAQFVATIHSLTPQPLPSRVTCVIRDWAGQTIATQAQEIVIDSEQPVEIRVAVPSEPHQFLEAEFSALVAESENNVPGQVVPAAYAYSVASVVSPRPRPPSAPSGGQEFGPEVHHSAFGMGVYLYRCYPDHFDEMERLALEAERIGVNWTREEFSWAAIEPRRGEFHFAFYDEMVDAAKRHGLQVYGLLDYWSSWTKPYTPEGIEDYARYVRAVVDRYKNDIHHWEIWNEPNTFFWSGPQSLYGDLLESAYEAVKQSDPTAQVVGFSTAGIDLDFIQRITAQGTPFDILSVHPYRVSFSEQEFLSELDLLTGLARDATQNVRPIWITEMGFSTNVAHNTMGMAQFATTQREQAQLLARTYITALGSGYVTNLTWYELRDHGTNLLEPEDTLGIMTREWHPKPAYRAYATLTRLLEGKTGNRLDWGEDVVAFAFTNAHHGDRVLAVWAKGWQETKTLVPSDDALVLTNLMGESRTPVSIDGQFEVDLLPLTPVFLSVSVNP